MTTEWAAVGPVHMAPARLRPSMWAALDVPFKAIGGLAFLFAPLVAGAWFANQPVLATILLTMGGNTQVLIGFFLAFGPAIRLMFTRYVIDDEGIRVETRILTSTESRVRWDKVTAVRHRRTLIDRMLGIERVDIVAYGERGTTLHLVGLRDAAVIRDLASRRMRESASVDALFAAD